MPSHHHAVTAVYSLRASPRHSRECGNLVLSYPPWIPACAGMTAGAGLGYEGSPEFLHGSVFASRIIVSFPRRRESREAL